MQPAAHGVRLPTLCPMLHCVGMYGPMLYVRASSTVAIPGSLHTCKLEAGVLLEPRNECSGIRVIQLHTLQLLSACPVHASQHVGAGACSGA